MEIREIENKEVWDNWVAASEDFTFLQSWDWGEVNKGLGWKIKRVGWWKGDELVGVCFYFVVKAKRGSYLFVPHGPLMAKKENFSEACKWIIDEGRREKVDFVRICPWLEETDANTKLFRGLGYREAPVMMHAEDTWLVDLRGTEEEVMGRMRKTTRNLIRRGEKDGVEIEKCQEVTKVNYLYDLQMEVVKRNNFVPFSKRYLEKEMEIFFADDRAVLFLGSFEGQVLGVALIVFLGKFAFYYQSGSMESKVPINYLLQWEVIREARSRGCEIYNMWGVAPPNLSDHPWIGLSTFKMGFGGEYRKYMRGMDYPLTWKYQMNCLIEKIPKTWRQKMGKVLG